MSPKHPICTKTFTLNNDQEIPAVGLGTWLGSTSPSPSQATELHASLLKALSNGYHLIDTAQYYGIESIIGSAILASGIPRSEITVVTKFWGEWHHDPASALEKSLSSLGLGYIDIFLMHWPNAIRVEKDGSETNLGIDESPTFLETWKVMEGLVGPRCRGIGVSNFTQKTLQALIDGGAKILPCVNQVELHAFNPNLKLVPWSKQRGIHTMSWSTLGGFYPGVENEIFTHSLFKSIAAAHDCAVSVVSLSWAVQRGITIIPKSNLDARVAENIRLVDLSEDEMEKMNNAHKTIKQIHLVDWITAILGKRADGTQLVMGWTKEDFGWEDKEGNWLP